MIAVKYVAITVILINLVMLIVAIWNYFFGVNHDLERINRVIDWAEKELERMDEEEVGESK